MLSAILLPLLLITCRNQGAKGHSVENFIFASIRHRRGPQSAPVLRDLEWRAPSAVFLREPFLAFRP
jgi:hypothetical protein